MRENWNVEFSSVALKSLKNMDKLTAAMIVGYVERRLTGNIDPRSFGKLLVANHKEKWRYRIGKFRLLCKIEDVKIIVHLVQIGQRSDVYK